jgi:hypothetical protein
MQKANTGKVAKAQLKLILVNLCGEGFSINRIHIEVETDTLYLFMNKNKKVFVFKYDIL